MENQLELTSKDKRYVWEKALTDEAEDEFHSVLTEFCLLIDKIYAGEKSINLFDMHKYLGKMELIALLIKDDQHRDLLESGKKILQHYIEQHEQTVKLKEPSEEEKT